MADSYPMPSGRIAPYSEEAERGVLGSALLNPEKVIDLMIQKQITPKALYFEAHKLLFECLVDMHSQGQKIDLLTASEYLRDKNLLQKIGGPLYIQQLLESTPTTAHAEFYMDIVHKKFILREVIEVATGSIDQCYGVDAEADQILARAESELFALGEHRTDTMKSWPHLVQITLDYINTLLDSNRGFSGMPTGFVDLDKKLHGFQKTDMIVLAARPSMGKTSLALNIAENIAMGKGTSDGKGIPVGVFSLEMSAEQLTQRMLACHSKVGLNYLRGGFLPTEIHGRLMQGASTLKLLPIHIDDTPGLDILELRSRARRLKAQHGIQFIVVDYLQLMNYEKFSRQGRQLEVAAMSGQVKAMAKELDVPVLVLSQLSRAPETRGGPSIPKLSDLRDSGAIEQDADVVLLLRRPARSPDDPEHADEKLAILDVAKHRNGETGEVRMNFEGQYTRFEDRIEDREEF
ncbi:MAG: replicative DNA helicase [Kiritimatiellia bacterium]|jgi:replicative DNA helicase